MSTLYAILDPNGMIKNNPKSLPELSFELGQGEQLSVIDCFHEMPLRESFYWYCESGSVELEVGIMSGKPRMELKVVAITVVEAIRLRRLALRHMGFEVGAPPPELKDLIPAIKGRWNRLAWLANWIWNGSVS